MNAVVMGDLRPMPRLRCPLVPLSLWFSLLRPFDTPQSTPSSPPKSIYRSLTGQSRTGNGLVPIIVEQTVPRREQNAHTRCRAGSPRGPSGFSVNGCIFDRAICADHTSMIRQMAGPQTACVKLTTFHCWLELLTPH